MISPQDRRPPFVVFEYRAVEDRAASIKAGSPQYTNELYATITAAGSKDNVVRPVKEWFEMLRREVQQERFPAEWLTHYERQLEFFTKGEELPVDGLPVKMWPAASPAQVKQMLDLHVLTVEQLAEANEELIAALGMGGRALVQKAKDYLRSAGDHGGLVMELETLRRDLAQAELDKKDMQTQLSALQNQVDALNASLQQANTQQKAAPAAAKK